MNQENREDMRRNSGGKARVLSVGVDVLLAIKNTGIATALEVQQQAMQTEGIRCVQRYLNSMVQAGLLYTGKSKLGEAKRSTLPVKQSNYSG